MSEEDKQGPRYPFIPLRKAIERARKLWDAAGDHSTLYNELVSLWGYKLASSGGTQTVAALRYYGLLIVGGVKDTRKFRLTEEAKKYFLDERPEKHAEAHKNFALAPKAMQLMWDLWKNKPPAEPIARSTLKVDYNYSENNAKELLAIYADNLEFAGLCISDIISPTSNLPDEPPQEAIAGPATGGTPRMEAVAPASRGDAHVVPKGIREDTCNLPEGTVTLSFPEAFSKDSYDDLQAWLDFQKNRLKRWISEQ